MKELELSQLCTGVPVVEWNASIEEVIRVFEDNALFDTLVVIREGKPLGIVYKAEAKLARYKRHLTAADIGHLASKVRNVRVDLKSLVLLLDMFTHVEKPVILVDKKGNYMGLIFHEVLLHYISMYSETKIPLLQRVKNLLGQKVYLHVFTLEDTKVFKEKYGSEKERGLFKILYEDVRENADGDVYLSEEDKSVYVLSKNLLDKDKVKEIMEEFHKEYSLLYAEFYPIFVHGMSVNLEKVKSLDELFDRMKTVKHRFDSLKDVSFFIYHDEIPSILVCEYRTKALIPRIREKLLTDFLSVVDSLSKSEKDTWEYVLYDHFKTYPYFELFYIMNDRGIQISNNVVNPRVKYQIKVGRKGADRSGRFYFKGAMEYGAYISDIYISQATDDFCITISCRFNYGGKMYVLAGDINYREIHGIVKEYASL